MTTSYHIQRVYFVAEPDEDGLAPSLEGAVGDRVYADLAKARAAARTLNLMLGKKHHYRVFVATLEIPRNQCA